MTISTFLILENEVINPAKPFVVIDKVGDDARIEHIAQTQVGFGQVCHVFKMTFPPDPKGWRRQPQYAILVGIAQENERSIVCTFAPTQRKVSSEVEELWHIGSQEVPTIKPVKAPAYLCLEEFFPESFRAGTYSDFIEDQLESGDIE